MRYTGLLLAFLVMFSAAAPAAAQGLTGERIEESLNPLVALIEGITRIGWTLTRMFVGMDEASMAYFAYELGFRGDEVYVHGINTTTASEQDCSVGSFDIDTGTGQVTAECVADATAENPGWTTMTMTFTAADIDDADGDGNAETFSDLFRYISDQQHPIEVSNSAKGQVMLFAIIIPLGILFFLLYDFFSSTGMLRSVTSAVVSLGIALIAARSGVYTALLGMISDLFGAGGFFLSMLSIYLILAILLWFYGGIRRSKKIAESEDEVADAVVKGFASDLGRGLMQKETAKELAKKK
jgi:hypothetical protein